MLCLLPLLPKQASTVAPSVDHLLWFVIGISVFFTALIFLLLLVFAIKYRRRAPDEVPQQIHGNIPLELTWTIIPIIIVIVIFVWGVDLFVRERRAPMDAVHVYVVVCATPCGGVFCRVVAASVGGACSRRAGPSTMNLGATPARWGPGVVS